MPSRGTVGPNLIECLDKGGRLTSSDGSDNAFVENCFGRRKPRNSIVWGRASTATCRIYKGDGDERPTRSRDRALRRARTIDALLRGCSGVKPLYHEAQA